jgi:hypothetical protein
MVAGVHEMETEVTCEETGWVGGEDCVELEPPPQAAHRSIPANAISGSAVERPVKPNLRDMLNRANKV